MSDDSQKKKKLSFSKQILKSGIPLEMATYDSLVSALDSDWIIPEYRFSTLNEDNIVIDRSIDFVCSAPSNRDGLDPNGKQIYYLLECKYTNPADSTWLFMRDKTIPDNDTFGDWYSFLWQDRQPITHTSTKPLGNALKCIRGVPISSKEQDIKGNAIGKSPSLTTALHQLRDCVHAVAIERFRLFTKMWMQPALISFIPIIITTADLRILKDGCHKDILSSDGDKVELDSISETLDVLLVRCPSCLKQIDFKWNRFNQSHGKYDLCRVEKGLPMYKRERTIEYHLKHFFSTTPQYIIVTKIDHLDNILKDSFSWISQLGF